MRFSVFIIFIFTFSILAKADLIIGGDDTNISVIEIFAKHFEKKMKRGPVKIISTLGSKGGIAALNDNKIHLAMVTRNLSSAEESFNLVSVPYAKACLAFVVNPDSTGPIDELTAKTVENIYSGSKTTWTNKNPIHIIFHPRGNSGANLLLSKFPELHNSFEKAWTTGLWRQEFRYKKYLNLIENVNNSFGWINQSELVATKSKAKVVEFEGLLPAAALAESGKYPLVETLTLVYKEPATKEVKQFIELIKSDFGTQILRQNESVPIR